VLNEHVTPQPLVQRDATVVKLNWLLPAHMETLSRERIGE